MLSCILTLKPLCFSLPLARTPFTSCTAGLGQLILSLKDFVLELTGVTPITPTYPCKRDRHRTGEFSKGEKQMGRDEIKGKLRGFEVQTQDGTAGSVQRREIEAGQKGEREN